MTKPDSISSALTLLYTSLFLSLIGTIAVLVMLYNNPFTSAGAFFLTCIITYTVLFFLVAKIANGRLWARTTFLVLFIIGLLLSVVTIFQLLGSATWIGLISIAVTVMQIIALTKLYNDDATKWFYEMSKPAGMV